MIDKRETYPTKYPEVNAIVDDFHARAKNVLGEDLVGIYLCGSVALNDFVPDRSDVDAVIVTAVPISGVTLPALEAMHIEFVNGDLPLTKVFEGSYIPLSDLSTHNTKNATYPRIDCGETLLVEHSSWWVIDQYVLMEHGIIIDGPSPNKLFTPVSQDELNQAIMNVLHHHWEPKLQEHGELHIPGYQVYAILTMCRILYSLQHGTIVSKRAAATWAKHSVGERNASLIDDALAWRNGCPFNNLKETLDLIKYTLGQK